MNFLDKLNYMMKKLNINRAELSRISNVPYTTIDGFYKKGYDNTKISTIKKIAHALGVSLDYLVDDTITDENYGIKKIAPSVTPEAMKMAVKFDSLSERDKRLMSKILDTFVEDTE